MHSNERNFKCDFADCGKAFKTSDSLKSHQKLHSLPTLKCNFEGCKYSGRTKDQLRIHQKFTHSNDRPFVCEFEGCEQRFKAKQYMRKHFELHYNKDPVVCPVEGCNKLIKPQALKPHILLHSKDYMRCDWDGCLYKTKSKSAINNHKIVVHTQERNYTCNLSPCSKSFKSEFALAAHIKIHTTEKRFKCEWPGCLYRTHFKNNL